MMSSATSPLWETFRDHRNHRSENRDPLITISLESVIIFPRNPDHDHPGIAITIARNRRSPSPGIPIKDKEEILDSLCEETFCQLYERQRTVHDALEGDALEHLKKGVETYIRFGLEHPEHYMVTFLLRAPTPDNCAVGESRRAKAVQRCFDGLRGAVRLCIEGKIKNADLEETSQAIWAGAHGLTALLITQTCFPFVDRERLIQRMVEILVMGVSK